MLPAVLTLRKATALAICFAVCILGCGKKEPEEGQPVRVVQPALKAPPGMTPVRAGVPVFISQKPLTVGQYLAYLEGTEQPIPVHRQDVEPGTPQAGQPVTGLDRQEAAWCAAWHLKRLPTAEEWRQAGDVVGPRPYPWSDDGAAVAQEAEILLVQDWVPGSNAQLQARAAREGLAESILAERCDGVEKLRQQLLGLVEVQRTRRGDLWKQLKPAFFSVLDREKKLAEERARREGRAEVLEILQRLEVAKGRLAAGIKANDLSAEQAEQAAERYTGQLGKWRTELQGVRDQLQDATNALQEEVVALTKVFEEAGTTEAEGHLDEAEAALADSAAPIESIAEAAPLERKLVTAIEWMRGEGPAFAGIPTLEDLNTRMAGLDQRIEELAGEDPVSAQIEEVRQRLERFGQAINRAFLQEKLLLEELDELVELRARKKAVETMLKGLNEALTGEPAAGADTVVE